MNSKQSTTPKTMDQKDTTNDIAPSPSDKVFIPVEEIVQLHQKSESDDEDQSSKTPSDSATAQDNPDMRMFHQSDRVPSTDSKATGHSAALFDDTDSDEYIDDSDPAADHNTDSPVPKHKKRRWPWITAGCVLFVLLGYLMVAYIPSGPIANLRNVYIQTAMSTADHQWLATWLFSDEVIARAWTDPNVKPPDAPDNSHLLETATPDNAVTTNTTEPVTDETTESVTAKKETTEPVQSPEDDILGLTSLKVGDTDYAGNKVIVADKEEGLFISEFTLTSTMLAPSKYHGYVMLIDDPSRVFVGSTPKPYVIGYRLGEMMDYYGDVIAGINASGFSDPNDAGTGGDIIGACFSESKFWGQYTNTMASVVLTKEDKLVAGWLGDWSKYTNIRDGMQFGPVLVDKGKNLIDEASGGGWGVHPRSAIGQREDGAIIMIVIDGRVPSSIGCTLWEMADMMVKYGAVTAGGCDGGSSVVLGYGDEILNDNSSANPDYGRKMPNAFLVRSKKNDQGS